MNTRNWLPQTNGAKSEAVACTKSDSFLRLGRIMSATLVVCFFAIAQATGQNTTCFQALQVGLPSIKVVSNQAGWIGNPGFLSPGKASALIAASGGNIINGIDIFFDGQFIVDAPIYFQNCPNLIISPTAQMTVLPGVHLSFNNCSLRAGCGSQWSDIDASHSSSTVSIRNSILSDMSRGIQIRNDALLICEDNQFVNNEYSIFFSNCLSNSYNGTVKRNQFYSTPAGQIAPHLGDRGRYGIFMQNTVSITIGDWSIAANGNSFDDLSTGIKIEQYTVNVSGNAIGSCSFNSIDGTLANDVFADDVGSCIHAVGNNSTLNVVRIAGDLATANSSYFQNSNKGVVMDNFSGDVAGVSMENVFYGFSSQGKNYRRVVKACGMNNVFIGIYSMGQLGKNSSFTENYIATYNTVGAPSTPPRPANFPSNALHVGIWVEYPTSTTAANNVSINSNRINVRSSRGVGIYSIFMVDTLEIRKNYVAMTPPVSVATATGTFYSGIICQGPDVAAIERNTIIGDDVNPTSFTYTNGPSPALTSPGSGMPAGIQAVGFGSQALLRCNNISYMRYGIFGRGLCGPNPAPNFNLAGNQVSKVGVGLFGREQIPNGTATWGLNIGGGPSLIDNENVFSGPNSDYVQSSLGFAVKVYVHSVGASCGLFNKKIFTDNISNFESISNSVSCQYDVISGTNNSFSCMSVALRTTSDSTQGDGGSSASTSAFDANLQELEFRINQLNSQPSSQNAAHWLETRNVYRAISRDMSLSAASSLIDSFYTALQGTDVARIYQAELAYNQLSDSATVQDSAAYAAAVSNAFTQLGNIIGVNTYAANEKTMLGYLLMTQCYGYDTLNVSQRAAIANMANTCIYAAGPAVYNARFLYSAYNGPSYFEDDELCNPGISARYNSIVTNYKVYPNPAQEVLNIERMGGEENEARLEIRNVTGTLVRSAQIRESVQQIQVSDMAPGLYLYQVFEVGKMVHSGKLIIKN